VLVEFALMSSPRSDGIGLWGVVAIGVGGMVGGGIFAVLGLAVQFAAGGTPVAFLIAGCVAILTTYSYARLAVALPSQGGTVAFLDKAFGVDLITGSVNLLLWFSYVVMLALYARAFGSYGATFFSGGDPGLELHILISVAILVPTALNILSADVIGRAETWIVGLKIGLLGVFVAVGFAGIEPHRLAPPTWSPALQLVTGGLIIFVAYEGFELIANAAADVREPGRVLPKAFFISVGAVIALYVLVSAVTVGNLPLSRIASARDYALAEAAQPFLGRTGFTLIAVAALLSTLSAINATLYGASRLSYSIARAGELPEILERKIWNRPLEGLLITSGLALLLANVADLSSISTVGSAGFLLVFAAVNAAAAVLADTIGARRWLALLGVMGCLSAVAVLVWQTAVTSPGALWVLAAMVVASVTIELGYRELGNRSLSLGPSLPAKPMVDAGSTEVPNDE
jgi:amino acid transporter